MVYSGYMAPEYAMDGVFSVKSDVFSFGVIVLEIIAGKRNRGIYSYSGHLNLLAQVSIHPTQQLLTSKDHWIQIDINFVTVSEYLPGLELTERGEWLRFSRRESEWLLQLRWSAKMPQSGASMRAREPRRPSPDVPGADDVGQHWHCLVADSQAARLRCKKSCSWRHIVEQAWLQHRGQHDHHNGWRSVESNVLYIWAQDVYCRVLE